MQESERYMRRNRIDEETHKRWWPLHIRRARGEALTPEEYALYENVQQQLDLMNSVRL
jgi:hypothetical protein